MNNDNQQNVAMFIDIKNNHWLRELYKSFNDTTYLVSTHKQSDEMTIARYITYIAPETKEDFIKRTSEFKEVIGVHEAQYAINLSDYFKDKLSLYIRYNGVISVIVAESETCFPIAQFFYQKNNDGVNKYDALENAKKFIKTMGEI